MKALYAVLAMIRATLDHREPDERERDERAALHALRWHESNVRWTKAEEADSAERARAG